MKNEEQEKTQAIAEIKERIQFAEWQRQIEERQSKGLGVVAWCEQQGISKSAYYYRLRRVRAHLCQKIGVLPESVPGENTEEAVAENRIVPIRKTVQMPIENRIEIISGDLRISFVGETTPSALKAVIEALRSC